MTTRSSGDFSELPPLASISYQYTDVASRLVEAVHRWADVLSKINDGSPVFDGEWSFVEPLTDLRDVVQLSDQLPSCPQNCQTLYRDQIRILNVAAKSLAQWLPVAREYLRNYDFLSSPKLAESAKESLIHSTRIRGAFNQAYQRVLQLSPDEQLKECAVLDSWVSAFQRAQTSLAQYFPDQRAQGEAVLQSMKEKVDQIRKEAQYVASLGTEPVYAILSSPEGAPVILVSQPLSGWRRWLSCFFSFFRFFFCPPKEGRGGLDDL